MTAYTRKEVVDEDKRLIKAVTDESKEAASEKAKKGADKKRKENEKAGGEAFIKAIKKTKKEADRLKNEADKLLKTISMSERTLQKAKGAAAEEKKVPRRLNAFMQYACPNACLCNTYVRTHVLKHAYIHV